MLSGHQIRGIIAISILLAFIPLIAFFYPSWVVTEVPILSTRHSDSMLVEVADETGLSGIYFVPQGTSFNQMISQIDMKKLVTEDMPLRNGMRLRLLSGKNHPTIVREEMSAAKRLALGLPVDVNRADTGDLMLIPGIGRTLAGAIVAWRSSNGRFERLDQLKDIKGIKEKKFSILSPYLTADDSVQ